MLVEVAYFVCYMETQSFAVITNEKRDRVFHKLSSHGVCVVTRKELGLIFNIIPESFKSAPKCWMR